MGFDVSQITSGYDQRKVLSDEKHYSSFVCVICTNLASLDAVVTSRCSHPFCRRCLESWVLQCNLRKHQISCPVCKGDLSSDPSIDCMEFGTLSIAARPLSEAQPLAYRVLALVQVQCVDEDNICNWTGDYGKFLSHAALHTDKGSDHMLVKPETKEDSDVVQDGGDEENNFQPQKLLEPAPEQTNEAGPSNISPRWKTSKASSVVPSDSVRDTPPSKITRKKSANPASIMHSAPSGKDNFDRSLDVRIPPGDIADDAISTGSLNMDGHDRHDAMVRGKHSTDLLGTSINSMAFWGESGASFNFIETTTESEEGGEAELATIVNVDLECDENTTDTYPEIVSAQLVDQTQRLKKQANAKFNKGDFTGARKLYTEAINIMGSFRPQSPEEKELMSHIHSNRAVTFFREKDFKTCIQDCKKAIQYDPSYDKNWIRMWRALMALGEVEEAHSLIEKASKAVPDSIRVREEYQRSLVERDLLEKVNRYLKDCKDDIAKDLLEESSKNTTNLRLLCTAARIEISLGQANVAMEQVNKALRLNPKYPEALEVHGHALLLMGDTEKASQVLYESYNLDSESVYTKDILTKCQKIHASLSQARSFAKRGHHDESLKRFNNAIKDCEALPDTSPLVIGIRCERAESYLRNKRFLEALKDCQDTLEMSKEHVKSWIIRTDVLTALGKENDALNELTKIRKGWGAGNVLIDDQYRKIDYEYRVSRVDNDLTHFVMELEAGLCERLTPVELDATHASERRSARRSTKSSSRRKKYEMSPKSPKSPHYDDSVYHLPEEESISPKRKSSDRTRIKKRSDRNGDESTVVSSRGKSRLTAPDDLSRASKMRPRRKTEDGESIRAKSRPRKSDEASVMTERRSRSRKHNDSVSVVSERRKSSSRRHRDDDLTVGTEKRKSHRRPDDTTSVVSSRRRLSRRESVESTRKERIDEAVNTLRNLGTKSR